MNVIGFRCFPDGFSYVVLKGSQSQPVTVAHARLTLPAGRSWGPKLTWLRKQIVELLEQYEVQRAGLKASEPMAKKKSLQRAELEGIVKEAAFANRGIECTARIKSQLKRDIARLDIITTKKSKSGAIRRITKDCAVGLSKSEMKSRLHKILARYVSHGK